MLHRSSLGIRLCINGDRATIYPTRKPLIALVWGGFYVMMAGGLLAFIKRSGEARRAVIAAERDAEPRTEPAIPATGPVLPAHSRSRLE